MKLTIDTIRHQVKLNDALLSDLTKREFQILNFLCEEPGRVYSRNQIYSRIWERQTNTNDRTVDVHIVQLRKKISKQLIKSIKGVGYKITLDPKDIQIIK
ncbi:MAG: winged helix-turn-helix transcriptional regulator [Saprospiraceae bacterium]|nr:winged helix-turn-helix transcriptional regulator [Saprospiraceae bacterium]HRG67948.1 winged helix-turn-helix domain-containing protein [Saprospiraceae bacterium]